MRPKLCVSAHCKRSCRACLAALLKPARCVCCLPWRLQAPIIDLGAECIDVDVHCRDWAEHGECEANPAFMKARSEHHWQRGPVAGGPALPHASLTGDVAAACSQRYDTSLIVVASASAFASASDSARGRTQASDAAGSLATCARTQRSMGQGACRRRGRK